LTPFLIRQYLTHPRFLNAMLTANDVRWELSSCHMANYSCWRKS